MPEKDKHFIGLILFIFLVIGGAVIAAGCLKQTGIPIETQVPGTQQTGIPMETQVPGTQQTGTPMETQVPGTQQTGTPMETQVPGTQQTGTPTENPFPGVWQFWGKIGDYKATIMFTFLKNKTGRYDLAVTDTTPPHFNSMEFQWESENDRLFIGSISEQQHMDIRYHPDNDRMVVTADSESGIFVGSNFVPGPFTWEFSRIAPGD